MRTLLPFLVLLAPAGLHAEARALCPDRPGLNTPPCIVDSNRLLVAVGVLDWTRDDNDGVRSDDVEAGQVLLRYAIGPSTEVQLGWTALISQRQRDSAWVRRTSDIGDVTASLRQGLNGGDGPIAVQAKITVPVSRSAEAREWEAAVLVPMSFDLAKGISFDATPEVDWRANASSSGRHLAYGSAMGLSFDVTDSVGLALEASAMRDHDPDERSTEVLASASLGWQPDDNTQFDVGLVKGLHHAPDVEIYFGISRRF